MKCTVQRCQPQPNTSRIACLRPRWASQMTSRTPRSPRARKPLRKARHNALGLGLTDVHAEHLAAAALAHAVGDHQRLVPHLARLAHVL